MSPQCPGVVIRVELTSDRAAVINPGGNCRMRWGVETGRVDLIDPQGRKLNVGPEGGQFPNFMTESVKATDWRGAVFRYVLTVP